MPLKYHKGWNNKMFVISGLMPHQIRITDIKVERLQDITNVDCMREGVTKARFNDFPNEIVAELNPNLRPRDIDKMTRKLLKKIKED